MQLLRYLSDVTKLPQITFETKPVNSETVFADGHYSFRPEKLLSPTDGGRSR